VVTVAEELVRRQDGRSDVAKGSLDDLIWTVRDEPRQGLESAASALLHARFAGEALTAARALVGRGEWLEWLLANFDFKLSSAYNYMRIAKNWDAITEAGYEGLSDAVKGMARKGLIVGQKGRPGVHKYGPDVYASMRDLHAAGWSMNRISIEMGCSSGTVARAVNPEKERARENLQNARNRERRKAVKEQRRRDLAKKAGGDISASYSATLKLAETLAAAISDEGDPSAKGALNSALLHLYGVEDLIVKALGTHKARD
jgi:hypothetical protein